jgi:hypothetical protein
MLAGVTGFLRVQYTAIARIAVLLSIVITLSYLLRPEGKQHGIEKLGNAVLGMLGSFSFIMVGLPSLPYQYARLCLCLEGMYLPPLGLRLAGCVSGGRVLGGGGVHEHVGGRTDQHPRMQRGKVRSSCSHPSSSHASLPNPSRLVGHVVRRRSYMEALIVCFNGGAFSAVLDITLCVAGVTVLYITLYTAFVSRGILDAAQVTRSITMQIRRIAPYMSCLGLDTIWLNVCRTSGAHAYGGLRFRC